METKEEKLVTDVVSVKNFGEYLQLKKYETLLAEKMTVLKARQEETLRLMKDINEVAVIVRQYQTKLPQHAAKELKELARMKAGF